MKCPLVSHPSKHWSLALYEGLFNGTIVVVDTMKNYDTYFKDLTTWENVELASTTIVVVCV